MTLAETFYKPSTSSEFRIYELLSAAFTNVLKYQKPKWYIEGLKLNSIIPSPVLVPYRNIEDIELPTNVEGFALFYEELISYDKLKKSGIFYTPANIADLIVKQTLANTELSLIKSQGILDPACGSGIFLIKAFSFLKNFSVFTTEEIICSLCGVDIDPVAVEVTKLALLLLAEDSSDSPNEIYFRLCKQIHNGNSLISPENCKENIKNAFSWRMAFPEKIQGGFACIIGNPPYGLSRNDQISNVENKILKEVYSQYRQGKVNKYLLFIAKSAELLAKDGTLSFIVPNSWLGIRSGEKIRNLLLDKMNLEEISFFNGSVFSKASVETIIFKVSKKEKLKTLTITCRDHKNNFAATHSNSITKTFCKQFLNNRLPLIWDEDFEKILEKIFMNSIILGSKESNLKSAIALQAYAVNKGTPPQTKEQVKSHCFHSSSKKSDKYFPYLEGTDIERYKVHSEKSYLKYGPWLAEPQKFERFCGPRILVREIINRGQYMLNAAYIESTAFYNKSILHILPLNDSEPNTLHALTGVLNSTVASFILLITGRKTQRALFPKILNSDLQDFPIPKSIFCNPNEYCCLMKKNIDQETQAKIDSVVAAGYGLDAETLVQINNFLDKAQKYFS